MWLYDASQHQRLWAPRAILISVLGIGLMELLKLSEVKSHVRSPKLNELKLNDDSFKS